MRNGDWTEASMWSIMYSNCKNVQMEVTDREMDMSSKGYLRSLVCNYSFKCNIKINDLCYITSLILDIYE